MTGPSPTAPSSDQHHTDPGSDVDLDAEQRRRAALVAAGAADDVEEAHMFLEMLGLKPSGPPAP